MNPTCRAIAVLLLSGLLGATGSSAGAATLTQSEPFGLLDTTPGGIATGAELFFDQFDPSLGTLQQVFIGLFSLHTVQIEFDAAGDQRVDFQATSDAGLILFDAGTVLVSQQVPLAGSLICFSDEGCPDNVVGNLAPFFATITLFPASSLFPFFLGPGTVEFDVEVDGAGGATDFNTGANVDSLVSAGWLGTLTLTYTYEPAEGVPAPAGLILVLAGLAGFLARTRRPPRP
jgi:hypothetical protein